MYRFNNNVRGGLYIEKDTLFHPFLLIKIKTPVITLCQYKPCPRGNAGESLSTYGGIIFFYASATNGMWVTSFFIILACKILIIRPATIEV